MKLFEGSDASEFFQADAWTRRDELAAWFMAARIADLVAAKDAEIAQLRWMLKERDGGSHDADCSQRITPCGCGHDDVMAYFMEIEG